MRYFLIVACIFALTLPVFAEPVFSESFDYNGVGKLLPEPWTNEKDKDGNDAGAVLYDKSLTYKGIDSRGLAATFKDNRNGSYTGVKAISLSNTKVIYIRCLVEPVVKTDNGWGTQPVCVAFANSKNQYKDGIWVGITQDVKGEKGEKKRDYFAVATGARPTQGLGNNRVFVFTDMGPIQDQAVYLLLAKFEINNSSDKRTCKAYLNVYKPGSQAPAEEPASWQFESPETEFGYPLGNSNYTFDQVIIHRDNLSESAIFDEILITTDWGDIGEESASTATTEKVVKPQKTENTEQSGDTPNIKIKINPINTGHSD